MCLSFHHHHHHQHHSRSCFLTQHEIYELKKGNLHADRKADLINPHNITTNIPKK